MNHKINDRVQIVLPDGIKEGSIIELFPAIEPEPPKLWLLPEEEQYKWRDSVKVKWDDNTEEILFDFKVKEIDSEIEREFRLTQIAAVNQIDNKISEAIKLVREACDIAEKYGVPFRSLISPLSQNYLPSSYESKFNELSEEFVSDLTGCWPSNGCYGWEHSAVC